MTDAKTYDVAEGLGYDVAEGLVYDVAVVGYGPAGVVAAGLLGQAGLSVYACDKLAGVYDIPRAISLDHEVMRVFQKLGIETEVLQFCEPFTNSEFFGVDGQLIRRMTMLPPPYPMGYAPSMVFTQPLVERILRQRVAQMPNVTVALGVACSAVAQSKDGVTLAVNGQSIRAKYVIAADGASSGIREQLGIGLDDLQFDEPWLVVDVLVNERGLAKLPKTSVQFCEPDRPCTLVIGPKNHRRWEISLKTGEDPMQAATPEGTWALLSRWLTPEDGVLWRQASYRFHALVAKEWRSKGDDLQGRGRIFLAGDAAHQQPPFLGQGMCQAIRDVVNLTWKLVSVLNGEVKGAAAERLLDSYGQERSAHVHELTTRIKHVGAVICERDTDKARARDVKMLLDCGGVVKDTPRQSILPALSGEFIFESPAAGTLFPQPKLKSVETAGDLMDKRFGTGWRLVSDGSLQAAQIKGLTHIHLQTTSEVEGVVAAWMQSHQSHVALVRPDHYTYGTAATQTQLSALLTHWQAALFE